MGKIPLTLSCWEYDRTRALQEGRVQVEGVELTYLRFGACFVIRSSTLQSVR